MKTIWSIDIDAPLERVWEEIIRTGTVLPFYFDSVLEGDLRPGGKLRYVSADHKHTFIEGEVVQLTRPTTFAHTFRFTDLSEPAQLVSFALENVGTKTRLTVRHERLDSAPQHARRVDPGWTRILGDLKSQTESGRVSVATRFRNRLMRVMLPFLPKPADERA